MDPAPVSWPPLSCLCHDFYTAKRQACLEPWNTDIGEVLDPSDKSHQPYSGLHILLGGRERFPKTAAGGHSVLSPGWLLVLLPSPHAYGMHPLRPHRRAWETRTLPVGTVALSSEQYWRVIWHFHFSPWLLLSHTAVQDSTLCTGCHRVPEQWHCRTPDLWDQEPEVPPEARTQCWHAPETGSGGWGCESPQARLCSGNQR